jgi:hypothetical protein
MQGIEFKTAASVLLALTATNSCGGSSSATVADSKAPSVNVLPFTHAFPVKGVFTVTGSATDDVGVTRIDISLDGAVQKTCRFSPAAAIAACKWNWDTTSSPDGKHSVDAQAFDAAGNVGTGSEFIAVGNVPPQTAITFPTAGATVSGTVDVSATSSSANLIIAQQILLDSVAVASCPTSGGTAAPCVFHWDTSTAAAGTHVLSSQAQDDAGNVSTSAPISIVVQH